MKINYILFVFSTLLSCQEISQKDKQDVNDSVIQIRDDDTILLNKIFVEDIKKQDLYDTIEFIGKISIPPQNIYTIYSLTPGFVKDLSVYQGSIVKKGEVLCYLTHPDIISKQQEFLRLYIQYQTDSLEYMRQLNLFEDSATSSRSLEVAKSIFFSTKSQLKSIEKLLKDINLNPQKIINGNIFEQLAIESPIDGIVKEIHINSNALVQPNTLMFSLLDINHLHVEFFVNIDVSKKININDTVRIKNFQDDREIEAKIINISPFVDESSKLVNIHCHFVKNNSLFIVGEQVRVLITPERINAFILPKECFIFINSKNYIFTKSSDEKFILKEVKLIKSTGNNIIFNAFHDSDVLNNVVIQGVDILKAKLFEDT